MSSSDHPYDAVKRAIDIVVSGAGLIVTLPRADPHGGCGAGDGRLPGAVPSRATRQTGPTLPNGEVPHNACTRIECRDRRRAPDKARAPPESDKP